MSIFKTTLNVESTDQSTPVKFTTVHNNNLLDNIVMGKITISTTPTEIPLGGENSRGSYLYVKSSVTNPKQNIVGIISAGGVITLSPGEFAVIPSYTFSDENGPGGPFGSNSVAAFTTNGTAELEYFTGSRGEDVGESVLVTFNDGSSTWKYFTLDANTAIPGQGPNIFMNNSIGDTNVNISDYPLRNIETIVNQKGYIIRFYGNTDPSFNKFVFINRRGDIINTVDINQNYIPYNANGRANLITWYDGDDGHAIYFNGDNYYQHDFVGINSIYVDGNWDQCTADGTFPVYIEGHAGLNQEALFLIKGGDKTLIKITSPNSNWSNSYTYSHGNFIVVETITEGNTNDELITLEIFSTDGTLLKTVDFDNTEMSSRDYYFYGSGKIQIVYREFDSGDYIFLNYNQLTGKLNGEDLTWTSTYNDCEVICDPYYTDSALDYKPESVAIIMHTEDGNSSQYLLDQNTAGDLEVTYIINNDLESRNYVLPNTEDRYYASNKSNSKNFATDKDFILLSGDNRTSGTLVATRFTSGDEPARYNLINNLGTYDVSNGSSGVICFGDYRVLIARNTANTIVDNIVYDSKILDKISLDLIDTGLNYEFNTLMVSDYYNRKEWYFNTSTKKWVLIPVYTPGNTWTNYNESEQYTVNLGKILLARDQFNPTSHSVYGRMITRGSAAGEKELLKLGNQTGFEIYSWDLQMSTETLVLSYKENSNSNWKIRVFDLNLSFLYEIDTEKPLNDISLNYGKLNYGLFFDNNSNYTHYKFGKLLSSLNTTHPNGYAHAYNNINWY